jgi:RHS repeat-associated protein
MQYDPVGNVTSTTDFEGNTTTFTYDERDRLVAKSYPDGTSVLFTYTPTGQRATATDARGTTRYVYDARDRLLTRTDPDTTAISYRYDAASNRTAVTTPAGTTTYTFDALNRQETVTDPDGGLTRYTYDDASNLTRTELPNGTIETRAYDTLNRLTFLENRNTAGVISSYRYTLAPTGRRDAVLEDTGRRVDYAYDALDRLTREKITDAVLGDRTIDYRYDAVGNRLIRSDSHQGATEYTYDTLDRLITETLAGQVTQYTYDKNGNTRSRVSATERVFYNWDFENRLTAADTDGDGTNDERNAYDADGNRVSQTSGGQETRFLIDTVQPLVQVLLEYRPSGLITTSYVFGNGLISQTHGAEKSFYHADGLGSTRALTGAAGLVTDRYIYDAFGVPLASLGTTPTVYRFLGERLDPNLGLIHLRARYLSAQLGRFASRDPFPGVGTEPMTLHRYLYAGADPVNKVDPTGLIFNLTGMQLAVVIVGAGAGAYVGSEIGGKIGGKTGRVIGAIGGALLGGYIVLRFLAPPAPVVKAKLSEIATAEEMASMKAGLHGIRAKELAQVTTAGVKEAATKGWTGWTGGGGTAAIIPFPAFVETFQETKQKPNGNQALCIISASINRLVEGADPYTEAFFKTVAVSVKAAGGTECEFEEI